ncbi:peptidoglycan-binding protein [Burkholderia ubonensis]|uniref:LWXIA domain-containing protein n=1 Tax=Burkholderia ubonensis TaxID=101571 RepID=UPI000753BB0A|nr:LWXIA domain-containing protein [Burkholderia ubonensis]KVO90753.1 peptidoglycan-binding protein [Burkholderia ubonensis]KVZ67795.1 peptidoglycan-binding protein [Burkholderia ubonensis]KVZ68823.1 peptidoglycan-binding protein [Burkholderia ubonensis]
MLDIDGVSMGVNWMAFLERTLEAERAQAANQAAQQASDPSKQPAQPQTPPPIAVQVSPDTDPSKPTNADISSATALIQRLAAQYRPTAPDITVDDDLTKAAQAAIQGAQTDYDQALKDEQAKQTALAAAQGDPSASKDTIDSAQAAYTQAKAATASAQKTLDVTTDAGYMIAYGQQAQHDNAALDPKQPGSAQAGADAALAALKAAVPGIGDDPTQASQANWSPQQLQAYDAWQSADAKLWVAKAQVNADVANGDLAQTQLQSYLSDDTYADAVKAAVVRINHQFAQRECDCVIQLPDKGKPDEIGKALKSAADEANYANAGLNAATDAAKVADVQITYDAVSGKFGPTVMSTTVAAQKDLLNRAQASARLSGGYLQMLHANRQVVELQGKYDDAKQAATAWRHDNPGGLIKDPQPERDLSAASAALAKGTNAAATAHDSFVAAYGSALALHYDDVAAGVQDQYDHRTICAVDDPTPLALKTLKTVASSLHQASERLGTAASDAAMKQALADAQAKQSELKGKVDDLQKQYDKWNNEHGAGAATSPFANTRPAGAPANIALTAPVPFVVNPYAQALSDARATLDDANTTVRQTQLASDSLHQQVLFNQFDAQLDEKLRNPQTEADQQASAKALSDFFHAHRNELSQTMLDQAGEATQHGATIDFGKLDDTQQRNLVGVAIGLSPDHASSDPHAEQFTDHKKLETINKVRDELLDVGGGAATRVNVMPVVYASKDAGLVTSAIFKVTGKDGDTHYVDDQGSKYSSIGNFLDDNDLNSNGTLDIATGYDANGVAQVDRHDTAHNDSWWKDALHVAGASNWNLLAMGAGIGMEIVGGILDATAVGAPLGVALNVIGADVMSAAAGAAILNAGYDVGQRIEHDRTLSPFDAGARADYVNLLPGGVSALGKGLTFLSRTGTAVRAITAAGRDASAVTAGLKAGTRTAVKISGFGGAAEAAGQLGYDAATGHTERLTADAESLLLNAGLVVGPHQLKTLSNTIVRRTGSFGARDLGNRAVSIGDQRVTIGQDKYAPSTTMRVGRQQATLDGKVITVAKDGTLMAEGKMLTYDGMPIRVLNRGNDVNTGARNQTQSTAFLDRDGTITLGQRVAGRFRTRFIAYKTDARITADDNGALSLSGDFALKYAHELAPPPSDSPVVAAAQDAPEQPRPDETGRANPAAPHALDEPVAATSRAASELRRESDDIVHERAAETTEGTRLTSAENRQSETRQSETGSNAASPIRYRRVADAQGAGGPLEPMTFRERVAWTILNAFGAVPFQDGFVPRDAAVTKQWLRPLVEEHSYGGRKLYVVRNGQAGRPFATADGAPPGGHGLALQARFALGSPATMAEPIVLIGASADAALASELANVWNRPVFLAPRGALDPNGTLRATDGYVRFAPAPHPEVDLGPLHVDGNTVFQATTGKAVPLDEHLGAMLGFGQEKVVFSLGRGAVVGLYDRPSDSPESVRERARDERLALGFLRAEYDLPTVSMDGPFSHANRVAVLYTPRGVLHTQDVQQGRLPPVVKAETLHLLRQLKAQIAYDRIWFDVQGIYTADGRLLISDPGRIALDHDAYQAAEHTVDQQLSALTKGVSSGEVELAHPEMTEVGPSGDKPGLIARIQMRMRGAPLPNEVSALAQQSGTLAQQLRMLEDNGWRVRVGKRGGGSRTDARKKRVTLDGSLTHAGAMTYVLAHETEHAVEAISGTLGLDYSGKRRFTRKALEAEARAQLNAFEARYEIQMATGVDIAAGVRLPDPIQEVADNWQRSHDYAGTVDTLADAFARSPVSGANGKTYASFYGEAYDRNPARAGRTMPAPQETSASGEPPTTMRDVQARRVAWTMRHAERGVSPLDGDVTPAGGLSFAKSRNLFIDQARQLAVLPAGTQRDGTLLDADGAPVDPHAFALIQAPPTHGDTRLILSARHANEGAAAQLANLWQRPIYVPHPDAIDAHGMPVDLTGMTRYVPAAYHRPSVGVLSVDHARGGLYLAGDPSRPVDPADYLGPVLGSGANKTTFDAGAEQVIGVFRNRSPKAREYADEEIELERDGLQLLKDVYHLPTSTIDGPFSVANRFAALMTPSAQMSSVDVESAGRLPDVVSQKKGMDTLALIRRVTEQHRLLYDFQVLFARNGNVLLHDPGPIAPESHGYEMSVERIDELVARLKEGMSTGRIRLAHPEAGEAGAAPYAQRNGVISRIVTRFRGVVLRMRMHALARQSPTLKAQMRLLRSRGWQVKFDTSGKGQYADPDARTLFLDGNRRYAGTLVYALAHEVQHGVDIETGALNLDPGHPDAYVENLLLAEARAQVNASRVRDEILGATGRDIAEHVRLPDGLAEAADQAYASGDPDALRALAERFGDTRTSLPGNPTYREQYGRHAQAANPGGRVPKLASAAGTGGTAGAAGAAGATGTPGATGAGGARAGDKMTRARARLDARGLRTLKRIEGRHAPKLRNLIRGTGRKVHVLIARAGEPGTDAPPEFVATARVSATGRIDVTWRGTLSGRESNQLDNALSLRIDARKRADAAKARSAFDFYVSKVSPDELQQMGGPSKIEPAQGGDAIEIAHADPVDDALADAIDALDSAVRHSNAKQAAEHARPDDTIYAVDEKTGEILGHATYDPAARTWQYEEKAPLDRTKVAARPLIDAFQRHRNVPVRPGGRQRRIPLSRARQRGVEFVTTGVGPDLMARIGRFDAAKPPKPRKEGKLDPLPRRMARYQSHRWIARFVNLGNYAATFVRTRTAVLLKRQTSRAIAQARSLAGESGLRAALVAAHMLPADAGHALDFSGHNTVHLLTIAEQGGLDPGTHRIYVYDTGKPLAHALDKPDGVLVPNSEGELRWYSNWRKPSGAGVPLDASPIGGGPYGANVHMLLTELSPDELQAHAPGTRLKALGDRIEWMKRLQDTKQRKRVDSLLKWVEKQKQVTTDLRTELTKQIERRTTLARKQKQPAPEHPVLDIKPYQPALVSSTLVEWRRRYGDGGMPDPLAHVARLKELVKRERDPRGGRLELDDAPADGAPPAVMVDGPGWRALGNWLPVGRNQAIAGPSRARVSPDGKRLSPRKRLQHALSAAATIDRRLIGRYLASSRAVQYRTVPMTRAYRLTDDPNLFLRDIHRHGAVRPVVTIVLDAHSLAVAQGARLDPDFVAAVKALGDPARATLDRDTATITGENGNVVHLDDLTQKALNAWLDAARDAGFLLRFETAPARALVSRNDQRNQPGTNDHYEDYVRLASMLQKWALANPGKHAPNVMVTFHGWDSVLEPVPGAGHVKLVEALLDAPMLQWVHVGLSYATHGSDFIANQELTTAIAKMLVERASSGKGAATFERLHGADALTRVFERLDADTLAGQHQLLFAEIERIGRENEMTPEAIDALITRLYEGNTTKLLNQARHAVAGYASEHWKKAPSRNAAAVDFTEDWLRDVGSKIDDPARRTLPDASHQKPTDWHEVVQQPELLVDDSKPLSDSRLVSQQSGERGPSAAARQQQRTQAPQPAKAEAEAQASEAEAVLHALRMQPGGGLRDWFTWPNVSSAVLGLAAGIGAPFVGMGSDAFSQTSNGMFAGVRAGRLVQALHQDSVRALQAGDPRLFRATIDRFVRHLRAQLDAHNMDKDTRGPALLLLANEARLKVDNLLRLHREQLMSADDAVDYTKLIANDMLAQMQGVLGGTSLQQMHEGNPRRFFGKLGRTVALAAYAGLIEGAVYKHIVHKATLATDLGGIGALLGLGYTAAVHFSAARDLSLERRSRTVRAVDMLSDFASIAAGYASLFVGPTAKFHTDLPLAFAGSASTALLALARVEAHFPNLVKPVTGRIPSIAMLAPVAIYVGTMIYTFLEDKDKHANQSGSTGAGTQPSTPSASPSPSASATPSASPSPTASPSASANPSASASATPPANPSSSATPSPAQPKRYFVVDGDTLWSIAGQNRGTLLDAAQIPRDVQRGMRPDDQDAAALKEILQLNPNVAAAPNQLSIGTPLVVG